MRDSPPSVLPPTGMLAPDVCFVISDLGSGGAQRVLLTVIEHWVAQGYGISVITLSGRDRDFHKLPPGVDRVALGLHAPSRSLPAAIHANFVRVRALRRAIRATGARLVMSFVGRTNVLAVLASNGQPWRLIVSERNDPARQSLGRAWDWLRRWAYPRAHLVTANSEGALSTLKRFVPAHRLAMLPNPLAVAHWAQVTTQARGPESNLGGVVLAVGRLHRQKAPELLIAAFARLTAPGWQLRFVGAGELLESLQAQCRQLGIQDRVEFSGVIADPREAYQQASVFALPSRHEGTPNALLEAMAAGLPCIVSDASPGPLEWVNDGETGRVVPVDDVAALAQALGDLIDDPGARRTLGAAAARSVKSLAPAVMLPIWARVLGLQSQPSARGTADSVNRDGSVSP